MEIQVGLSSEMADARRRVLRPKRHKPLTLEGSFLALSGGGAVRHTRESYQVSERLAYRLPGQWRVSVRRKDL